MRTRARGVGARGRWLRGWWRLGTRIRTHDTQSRAAALHELLFAAHTPTGPADEPKEIKALYKRFRRLDRSGRGTLSNDDLQMIPEIAMNPLSSRLQVLFVKDSEDRINFKSFVSALAIFSDKARPELKTRGACPAAPAHACVLRAAADAVCSPRAHQRGEHHPPPHPPTPQPSSGCTIWTATASWGGKTCGSCWR